MKTLNEYVKQNFSDYSINEYLIQDINQELEDIPANKSNYEFAFGTSLYTSDKMFWMNTNSIDSYKIELEDIPYKGNNNTYKNLYQHAKDLRDSFSIMYMCVVYDQDEHTWSISFCNHKSRREINSSLKYCKDVQYFKDVSWESWLKYIGEI